jgi:hypothetical protein
MKKILEAISGVNQRLDGVDKRLDNIDSKLDSVVIKVVSHDTALGQLVTKKEFAKFRDKNLELLDHIVGRLDVLSEEFQVLQAA